MLHPGIMMTEINGLVGGGRMMNGLLGGGWYGRPLKGGRFNSRKGRVGAVVRYECCLGLDIFRNRLVFQ